MPIKVIVELRAKPGRRAELKRLCAVRASADSQSAISTSRSVDGFGQGGCLMTVALNGAASSSTS
jgi:hypothetical protein